MSRSSRIVLVAAHLAITAAVLNLGSILAPPPASAALGDCSQPATNGPAPTATDCLYILNAAISLATCTPVCICAPRGSLPISATDALVCLNHVVGQPAALNCPCGSGSTSTITTSTTSTTSTSTTSTTSTSTTTTSTTTTTLGSVSCTVDTTECNTDACTCPGGASGKDYHIGANGQVSGPVGTQLRVNTQLMQGGDIDCVDWTRIDASVNPSCDTIGCCERESGDPEVTQWNVFQNFDFPCYCPQAQIPLQVNYVAQCQLGSGPVVESYLSSDPCQ